MNLTIQQVIMGYIACHANPIYILYFLMTCLRFRFYTLLEDRETMCTLLKRLNQHALFSCTNVVQDKKLPGGYFVGRYCLGYVEHNYEEQKLYMFAQPWFLTMVKEAPNVQHVNEVSLKSIPVSKPPCKIDVFIRKGTYTHVYYSKIKLDLAHIYPMGDQAAIVKAIVGVYDTMGRVTVFIDGVTNAGKSTIGLLVAKELRGSYCHTFNPTAPGDHLTNLTIEAGFEDGPLVVVLEEADQMLKSIHERKVQQNPKTPTLVHDKSTWSSFLDDMVFYKKVILIMTSNTPKHYLDSMDHAYLRKGRLQASFHMSNPIITDL
jgi:hypothetical protein